MNREKVLRKTQKRQQHSVARGRRIGIHTVKRAIRKAQRRGRFSTFVLIPPSSREYVKDYLKSKGFYVKKYNLGFEMDLTSRDELLIAWGDEEIENYRTYDKYHEERKNKN